MNLNDFDRFIEEKIIARGHDYYKNGYVYSLANDHAVSGNIKAIYSE